MSSNTPLKAEPSQQRLQRSPDFTGNLLNSFPDVALRHGLPGALLGALFLMLPMTAVLLLPSLSPAISSPWLYSAVGTSIFVAMVAFHLYQDDRFDLHRVSWMLYLLGISTWEEWVFRIALPHMLLESGVEMRAAILGSNIVFGLVHFFTLRWKWHWCLLAFLGGMGLSRNYLYFEDFLMIVAIHWIATYINTPRYPGARRT